uniref:G-protein coupled receptors family 1 profile domain-containing protein n=1 Tax=Strigamia maritima TaxID=126957 RepID=T1IQI9_STRMM
MKFSVAEGVILTASSTAVFADNSSTDQSPTVIDPWIGAENSSTFYSQWPINFSYPPAALYTNDSGIEYNDETKRWNVSAAIFHIATSSEESINKESTSHLNMTPSDTTNSSSTDWTWNEDIVFESSALAVVLALFCVITIFGNVLVMLAVTRERYLHTVTNYFIVSLAMADCLVGALVMPFSAVHEVMHKVWVFGQDWCDLWHSLDVLASTASILNLCVISLDRYWAITDPIAYPSRMTTKCATGLIVLVWVCAALISFPAIAWWRLVSPGPPPPYTCNFTEDVGYAVFSSIISFYAPLSVMLFTYFRIYRAATEQTKSLRLGTKQVLACNGEEAMELTLRMHRGGGKGSMQSDYSAAVHDDLLSPDALTTGANSVRIVPKNLKHFSFSRKLAKIAKEKKAAKTLGIVVGVFVLCWLPFFVTSILISICATDCIPQLDLVYSIVTWLGWINSGMNPVIYACWSRDFRRAFTKILCGTCCPKVMNQQYRHRLGGKVCHVTSDPISTSCSTDCVKL